MADLSELNLPVRNAATGEVTVQNFKLTDYYGGGGGASFDQIAPVESSPTTAAHSVGEHFIYGGVIYEVTSAIAVGTTLVIYPLSGYNIKVADTLEEQIEGKADKNQISNPNLLDNPWFTVNSRGQSSYSNLADGAYFYDRWRARASSGYTFSFTDDGLKCSVSGTPSSTGYCQQFLDGNKFVVGEIYTVSMIMKSSVATSAYLQLRSNGSSTIIGLGNSVSVTTEWKLFKGTGVMTTTDALDIRAYFNYDKVADVDIYIKAIKIEKGAVSTLDVDSPPEYAIELQKCQMSTTANSTDTYANYNSTGAGLTLSLSQQTSTSQDTAYTFSNAAIRNDSMIDVYTDQYGVNPSNVDVTVTNNVGTCTVTIPKQSTASTLGVKIYVR